MQTFYKVGYENETVVEWYLFAFPADRKYYSDSLKVSDDVVL